MATLSPTNAPYGDSYGLTPSAVLVAECPDRAREGAEALALAGIRAAAQMRFAEVAERLSDHAGFSVVLLETEGAPDALLDSVLARVDAIADERRAAVVAAIGIDQIDLAATHLLGRNCHLLCAPSMAERVGALAVAKRGAPGARLNDATRDAESERLQRLNEEVARIADTLARLTRGEEGERRGVRAPEQGYRGPDNGGQADVTPQEIRTVIRARRLRAQYFAEELFADPAWDMLLDLFASYLEGRRVSVSSLCIAAAVPPTTALRWIGTLHEAGLFERHADPADRRRAYIALSPKGLDGMRGYTSAVKRQGLPLI